jgi:hypothetical protein
LALSSLLFPCRWRQQSVQAQIHGSRAAVVGPVVGQGDEGESSRSLAATTVSPSLESSTLPTAVLQKSKLALSAVTSLSFPSVSVRPGDFASGTSPILGAEVTVRLDDVQDKVAERHLLWRGPEPELVGWHLFRGVWYALLRAMRGSNKITYPRTEEGWTPFNTRFCHYWGRFFCASCAATVDAYPNSPSEVLPLRLPNQSVECLSTPETKHSERVHADFR